MDPLTMYAIATVGVGAVQTVWNYFAGQSALKDANNKLDKQQSFMADRASLAYDAKVLRDKNIEARKSQFQVLDNQLADVGTQVQQAGVDLTKSVASNQAGLAQSGVLGPMADMVATQTKVDGQAKIDTFKSQAERDIALQRQQLTTDISLAQASADLTYAGDQQNLKEQRYNLSSARGELKAQQDQLNMDAWTSALGVGMSAAGTLVKGGAFAKKPTWNTNWNSGYANINQGIGIPGTR